MTITHEPRLVESFVPFVQAIDVAGEIVAIEAIHVVQTYRPSEPGRDRNGDDYAGGVKFATASDGSVYAREWDSSDWDDRHCWGRAAQGERHTLAALLGVAEAP